MQKKLIQATAIIAISIASTTVMGSSWSTMQAPSLSGPYFSSAFGNMPDGRMVYGEYGNYWVQNSWGKAEFSQMDNSTSTDGPSFVAVWNDTTAAAGEGGSFSNPDSDIDSFDPGNASTAFTPLEFTIGASPINNYDGLFKDENGLIIAGTNGSWDSNSISYHALDSSANKIIVDSVSTYSAGIAMDSDGNLFVADNDEDAIYKFAVEELNNAISGSALTMDAGDLVYDYGEGGHTGSIAVDTSGVIWSAGYMTTGILGYDPANGQKSSFVPGDNSTSYKVGLFHARTATIM